MNQTSLAGLVSPFVAGRAHEEAVKDDRGSFTFGELERLSDALAMQLRALGVVRESRVVVRAHRCVAMVPIALAIWKAGGVYVPLDGDLPEDRVMNVFANVEPVLLILPEGKGFASGIDLICQTLSVDAASLAALPEAAACLEAPGEEDLAVLIHTSGSTGLPKAVMLDHGSVLAYFHSHAKVFGIGPSSRCLNTASFHYDVSLQDTFMPLSRGGQVVVNRLPFFPRVMLALLQRERITHLTAVVTVLRMMTGEHANLAKADLSSLKSVSTGAEVCDPALMHAWMNAVPGLRMVNGYGPSEVNSASISYVIPCVDDGRTDYYPIGRPHDGVLAVLVDEQGVQIDRSMVVGELLLGGRQLMRGYWRDAAATERAFVTLDGQRYYRTGDLCSLDEAGQIVYRGRKDSEVKISGRRINLLEISAIVEKVAWIKAAGTVLLPIQEGQVIAALCEVEDGCNDGAKDELELALKPYLPAFMLPRRYGFYRGARAGATGKTDIKGLSGLLLSACQGSPERHFMLDTERGRFLPLAASTEPASHSEGVTP